MVFVGGEIRWTAGRTANQLGGKRCERVRRRRFFLARQIVLQSFSNQLGLGRTKPSGHLTNFGIQSFRDFNRHSVHDYVSLTTANFIVAVAVVTNERSKRMQSTTA